MMLSFYFVDKSALFFISAETVETLIRNRGLDWECLECGKTARTRQHIRYHAEERSHLSFASGSLLNIVSTLLRLRPFPRFLETFIP